MRGVHGEKIAAVLENKKLPDCDRPRVREALSVYDDWVSRLNTVNAASLDELIKRLVEALNRYKFYVDVNLIYDSKEDFLYRQRGQLKLDNTVIEEFMPIFVRRCIEKEFGPCGLDIDSQRQIFSSVYFASSMNNPGTAGEIRLKTKDYDFSISRKLYLKSSYSSEFKPDDTAMLTANLGYVMAELKTNLDKTMFQEACATAHDIKQVVPSAKYYLLCDYLDMTPISTSTTDIDEILIMRKARRISANIRKSYASYSGRQKNRKEYISFLRQNPYSSEVFKRFVEHVIAQMSSTNISEDDVLRAGYF